jgi:hypothetical protein
MMYADPFAHLTIEETLAAIWPTLPARIRARMERACEEFGSTLGEVWSHILEYVLDDLDANPESAARLQARLDRQDAPFGPDPLLRQKGR